MNLYKKYILPKYINLTMNDKDLEKHRHDTVSKVSGIVLEMGFGSGMNLPHYSGITKLYALDPSKELYDLAQEKIEKVAFLVEYLEASAEKIPLPDNFFDSAVSTWSLCSIPNPEIALKEIFRVLKPDGKFYFVEHGKSPNLFIFRLQNILTPISKCLAGGCHMNRNIEEIITGAGFEIQNLEKINQKFKPLALIYKGVVIAKK